MGRRFCRLQAENYAARKSTRTVLLYTNSIVIIYILAWMIECAKWLSFGGKFAISGSFCVIYVFAAELFPTEEILTKTIDFFSTERKRDGTESFRGKFVFISPPFRSGPALVPSNFHQLRPVLNSCLNLIKMLQCVVLESVLVQW